MDDRIIMIIWRTRERKEGTLRLGVAAVLIYKQGMNRINRGGRKATKMAKAREASCQHEKIWHRLT